MIPKIIHYCWLSGEPYPADIRKYMNTWKKILPDYEFMLWDTKRFNINDSQWVKQAFENKKYAFAADYIRVYALYHYGGIYLDTDVEVLKSYNPLLHLKVMVGLDHALLNVEAATWGTEKGALCMKVLLDYYNRRSFIKEDGTFDTEPMPPIVTRIWLENGFKLIPIQTIHEAKMKEGEKNIPVFPMEWFCPQDWYSYKLKLTKDTFSIHRYKGGWLEDSVKKERNFLSKLGPYLPAIWRKIQYLLKRMKGNG